MLSEKELKEARSYGSINYYYEIQRDLLSEPQLICPFKTRRHCDSMYIKKYNELKKTFNKLVDELDKLRAENISLKQLLVCYQNVMTNEKGGEQGDSSRRY